MKESTTRRWAAGVFPETNQNDVILASHPDPSVRKERLGSLMKVYNKPTYRYLRHVGCDHDEAKDTLQGLFIHIFEKNSLSRWTPERGRFRTFLLGITKVYRADELRTQRAQFRSPRRPPQSIEALQKEKEVEIEAKERRAEEVYDQACLLEMVASGREAWKEGLLREGKVKEARVIEEWERSVDPSEPDYAELGRLAGLSKQQAWRGLKKFFTWMRAKREDVQSVMAARDGDTDGAREDTRRMFQPGGVLGGGTRRRTRRAKGPSKKRE